MKVWYLLLFAWFVITALWTMKAFKDYNRHKWDRPRKRVGKAGRASASEEGS